VDKNQQRLFTIACPTCRARLVVKSRAAIGTILECPRCSSLVKVVPPPGWTPEGVAPPVQPALPGGPPPLDHVADGPLMLELEPAKTIGWAMPLAWTAALAVTCAAVYALWRLVPLRPEPAPVVVEAEAKLEPEPPPIVPSQKPEEAKDQEEVREQTITPGPQSRGVGEEPTTTPAAESQEKPAEAPAKTIEEVKAQPADVERPPIQKAPPAPVDLDARLNDPIAGLELSSVPLVRAVDLISAAGAIRVALDVDAMAQLGVTPQDAVSLELQKTTVGQALEAVAKQKGLALVQQHGQPVISAPADYRNHFHVQRYEIKDLTQNDKPSAAELATMVQRLVAPDSWQPSGGRGAVEADPGALIVAQTEAVHRQVHEFFERLRLARKKPPRGEAPALPTRRDLAKKTLERAVSANFHRPAALGRILAFLATAAECDILVDHAALSAADASDRVETSIVVANQPLGATLDQLLPPLGLTWRAIGPKTLQITTQEAAQDRLELEFYPISPRPLAGEGQGVRADELIKTLKSRVAPASWTDTGGLGDVYYDPPSQCVLVLQSQPIQAAVQEFFQKSAEE